MSEANQIHTDQDPYHTACFRCHMCSTQINTPTFSTVDGEIQCGACQTNPAISRSEEKQPASTSAVSNAAATLPLPSTSHLESTSQHVAKPPSVTPHARSDENGAIRAIGTDTAAAAPGADNAAVATDATDSAIVTSPSTSHEKHMPMHERLSDTIQSEILQAYYSSHTELPTYLPDEERQRRDASHGSISSTVHDLWTRVHSLTESDILRSLSMHDSEFEALIATPDFAARRSSIFNVRSPNPSLTMSNGVRPSPVLDDGSSSTSWPPRHQEQATGILDDIAQLEMQRHMALADLLSVQSAQDQFGAADDKSLPNRIRLVIASLMAHLDTVKWEYRRELESILLHQQSVQQELKPMMQVRDTLMQESQALAERIDEMTAHLADLEGMQRHARPEFQGASNSEAEPELARSAPTSLAHDGVDASTDSHATVEELPQHYPPVAHNDVVEARTPTSEALASDMPAEQPSATLDQLQPGAVEISSTLEHMPPTPEKSNSVNASPPVATAQLPDGAVSNLSASPRRPPPSPIPSERAPPPPPSFTKVPDASPIQTGDSDTRSAATSPAPSIFSISPPSAVPMPDVAPVPDIAAFVSSDSVPPGAVPAAPAPIPKQPTAPALPARSQPSASPVTSKAMPLSHDHVSQSSVPSLRPSLDSAASTTIPSAPAPAPAPAPMLSTSPAASSFMSERPSLGQRSGSNASLRSTESVPPPGPTRTRRVPSVQPEPARPNAVSNGNRRDASLPSVPSPRKFRWMRPRIPGASELNALSETLLLPAHEFAKSSRTTSGSQAPKTSMDSSSPPMSTASGGNDPPPLPRRRSGMSPGPAPPSAPTSPAQVSTARPVPQARTNNASMMGRSLLEQAQLEGKSVPRLVQLCLAAIEANGLADEGLYRKSGSTYQQRHIVQLFDSGASFDLQDTNEFNDVSAITGVLKGYLRQLPEPLVPYRDLGKFVELIETPGALNVSTMRHLLDQLPMAHYCTLQRLCKHLRVVHNHSNETRMTARNLGIVFGRK